MKRLLLSYLAFAGFVNSFGQEIGNKFSGKAEVPGLGLVEFPAGNWILEFRLTPPNPNPSHRPDYFGFKKTGDMPVRLGFRRYAPAIAPDNLSHLLDGIAEDLGEGAPSEVLGKGYYVDSTSNPLRFSPEISRMTKTETDISFSFINIKPSRTLNWLCHAHLYSREGWVYVVFHASPSVIDPETVSLVSWTSHSPAVQTAPTKPK